MQGYAVHVYNRGFSRGQPLCKPCVVTEDCRERDTLTAHKHGKFMSDIAVCHYEIGYLYDMMRLHVIM